ncbi:MAG TPA: hypothetical protein VLJ39_15960, partial [Tepidisphaeraceae bacterium]|nr:hypothetical protein [Tepidisphaeraceae bacterium]
MSRAKLTPDLPQCDSRLLGGVMISLNPIERNRQHCTRAAVRVTESVGSGNRASPALDAAHPFQQRIRLTRPIRVH